jgi:hypothetical protein
MSLEPYCMHDYMIPLPAGFRDLTVNVLEWDTADGEKIALVVQRKALSRKTPDEAPAAALERLVTDETKDYPTRFAGYRVEHDELGAEDGRYEMRRKAFRWRHEEQVIYHHQVFVLVGDAVVLFTGAGKARHREVVDRLLHDVVSDLRIRGD